MKIVLMTYSWLSIISLCIVYRGLPPLILLLKLFCAVTGVALGMYLWNDVCDFKQDMVSMEIVDQSASVRPLVRGLISQRRAGVFSALLVALGLTASALINLEVLLIQLAFLVIYILYSTEPIRLKRMFYLKQVTVAIGGAIACISSGLAVGTISIQLLYLTGLYVLFIAGVNPLGDLKDIESDLAGRVKTVPTVFGSEFTIRLSLATFTACAATTWIGYSSLGFNIALPIIGSIVFLAWFYVMYPLLSHLSDLEYVINRIYSRGLPLFFILQIAVLLGSLPF
ncbi:MAG: UbiA family prenyltransferase [Candidatus Bathyarchaeota archaeon]|nr:UbiA family prenyltransferase [Candidatus Bathyarchaeota archaeon]